LANEAASSRVRSESARAPVPRPHLVSPVERANAAEAVSDALDREVGFDPGCAGAHLSEPPPWPVPARVMALEAASDPIRAFAKRVIDVAGALILGWFSILLVHLDSWTGYALALITSIVALATLPLFFLERVSGAFFPEIAVAFLLALAASMAVALTVTPALTAIFLANASPQREAPLAGWLRARYENVLARIVQRPRTAYAATGALVVAAIVAAPFLGQSLMPTLNESNLLIRWDGPPGTSLTEMNRITARATRELRAIDGVADVGAHVGRAVTSDQVVGANAAEIWVTIDPKSNYDATVAAVKEIVAGYPGLTHTVGTYSNQQVDQTLAAAEDDVVIRLYGEDLKTLATTASEVRGAVSRIDGLVDERVHPPIMEPTLQIKVDLLAGERYGIKPGDVRRAAATLLSGIVAGSLFEQQKVFDVVVWGTPSTRSSLASIRNLLIDTPDGGHVRLGRVADARIVPGPAVIERQAVSRYLDVTANVESRDAGAVKGDIEQALQGIRFPPESHAEVFASVGQPKGRLISIAIAALIGIIVLVQALFGSWRLAAVSVVLLPVALTGGLLAALAGGGTLSVPACRRCLVSRRRPA